MCTLPVDRPRRLTSKKGRYNPVVVGGVVVVTLGFCAGLPAGGKSLMKSLIIFPPASPADGKSFKVISSINDNIKKRPA